MIVKAFTVMIFTCFLPACITNELIWRSSHDRGLAFWGGLIVYLLGLAFWWLVTRLSD